MWYPQLGYTVLTTVSIVEATVLNYISYRLRQSISYCSQAVKPVNTDQSMVKAIARVDCMVAQMIIVTLIIDSGYTQMSRDSAYRILDNPI